MGLFRYELRGLRPPLVYLKSLLHLRRSDRAVIVLILLPQCFEPLLLPPLLLQLFLLLPKLGQKEKETKKRRKLRWKMGDTVYMYMYIYIYKDEIYFAYLQLMHLLLVQFGQLSFLRLILLPENLLLKLMMLL